MRGLLHGVALCFAMFRSVSHCGAPHYALLASIAVRFNLMLRSLVSSRHKFVHLLVQVARVRKHLSLQWVWITCEHILTALHPHFPTEGDFILANPQKIQSAQQHLTRTDQQLISTLRSKSIDEFCGSGFTAGPELQLSWTLPARKNVIRHAIKNSKCHKICQRELKNTRQSAARQNRKNVRKSIRRWQMEG